MSATISPHVYPVAFRPPVVNQPPTSLDLAKHPDSGTERARLIFPKR